jgi:pyruvate kinase
VIVKAGQPDLIAALEREVAGLRADVAREGLATFRRWGPRLRRHAFRPSALNLAMYLALRRRDLRSLQTALMPLGLSSLGRCESRVLANLDAVRTALAALDGAGSHPRLTTPDRFFAGAPTPRRSSAQPRARERSRS